ncbi:MAG: helix-turn-helix domain-containing protein [Variibacter sp.]
MAYRRTEKVKQRLAARRDAIVAAAEALAAEGGMAAVQIAPVAARAGIAAGTVYRYFPSKTELVEALVAAAAEREIAAMRAAAGTAPGPMSALAAALVTFAARALRQRRLAWAVIAEPIDAEVDGARLSYRRAIVEEIETRLRAAIPDAPSDLDAALVAPALTGAVLEGLVGPLAPAAVDDDASRRRNAVQMLTLMALQGIGIAAARARGLVVQAPWPPEDAA